MSAPAAGTRGVVPPSRQEMRTGQNWAGGRGQPSHKGQEEPASRTPLHVWGCPRNLGERKDTLGGWEVLGGGRWRPQDRPGRLGRWEYGGGQGKTSRARRASGKLRHCRDQVVQPRTRTFSWDGCARRSAHKPTLGACALAYSWRRATLYCCVMCFSVFPSYCSPSCILPARPCSYSVSCSFKSYQGRDRPRAECRDCSEQGPQSRTSSRPEPVVHLFETSFRVSEVLCFFPFSFLGSKTDLTQNLLL